MRALALFVIVCAVGCGGAAVDRVSVTGVDRLSGQLSAQDVELPGAELTAVRGPAAVMVLGATLDGSRVAGGASPSCALQRKITGALVARTAPCGALLGQYAAME